MLVKKIYLIVILFSALSVPACTQHINYKFDGIKEQTNTKKTVYRKEKLTNGHFISQPCIVDSNLYILDNQGFLIAFSLSEGKILWKNKICVDDLGVNELVTGGIQYDKGKLYVNNGSKFVFVFDAWNGYEIIRKVFPEMVLERVFVIGKDKILVRVSDGKIIAYDFSKMSILWVYGNQEKQINKIFDTNELIIENNCIYNTFDGVNLLCIDQNSGKKIWELDLDKKRSSEHIMDIGFLHDVNKVLVSDFLFLLISNGDLIKIHTESGKIVLNKKFSSTEQISMLKNKILLLKSSSFVILDPHDLSVIDELYMEEKLNIKENLHFLVTTPVKIGEKRYYYVVTNLGRVFQFSHDDKIAIITKLDFKTQLKMGYVFDNNLILLSDKNVFF